MMPNNTSPTQHVTARDATAAPIAIDTGEDSDTTTAKIPRKREIQLYTSHSLSTWNSRVFEFGAVLFLATIFPNTLQPMSIYALVRNAAGILFAQSIGSWIDNGNRLNVVRTSIIGQRLAVAGSCGILWAIESDGAPTTNLTRGLFSLLTILACVEKLCALANLVSIERDWVGIFLNRCDACRLLIVG